MYTLLVTGDVPGASTYFNPLLQQTIVPCTSGTRPSSPPNGMHIYETDTKNLAKNNAGAWEYVASSRTSTVPTLGATTTPPTMGTGATRNGWMTINPGPSVTFTWFIRFGTSGVAAGTGNYTVSLPVNANAAFGSNGAPAFGSALLADNSSGAFKVTTCFIDQSDLTTVRFIAEGGVIVTNAAPWTWAAQDYIAGSITYPI